MKLSFVIGGALGYVLGAKAGRERYEAIVRVARKVVGSQTVQSTAGVLQAQVGALASQARDAVLHSSGHQPPQVSTLNGVNGHGATNRH